MQGLEEHFRDSCGGVIKWLDQETYYTAFTEGWGLYAENPLIGEDTDVYEDEPLQKYGMLKWQVSVNNRSSRCHEIVNRTLTQINLFGKLPRLSDFQSL